MSTRIKRPVPEYKYADLKKYAYSSFRPRPDQPDRYDQQTAFMNTDHEGPSFLLGGTGAGTTTCALAKAVNFMMKTPPPRKDTPFWILSDDFEITIKTCWVEKLDGMGHILPWYIDWDRISWYSPNENMPFSVPLKPWGKNPDGSPKNRRCPNGNWRIVFKSFAQKRKHLQGQSIGGFLFVEQFPWNLLEEVMGRCREYDFNGSKLAEFTPIDPELSRPLQDMEESATLPKTWGLYRANTECALECGHVTQKWFRDFYGLLPKALIPVRMKGLWGSYEGLVYPEFNTAIHCISEKDWDIPPACYHRRAIDWGAGPENPFACIWACRNGKGQYFIYDEYYSTEPIDPIKHLKRIQDQVDWPRNNPYYGMTWADPADHGAMRICAEFPAYAPGYEPINVQGARHDRDEGIAHVRWLLDCHEALTNEFVDPQPRLFVVKERCPNLIREFRTHRYLQSSGVGLNPRLAAREVLKKDDHLLDCVRYLTYSEHCQTGVTPQMIERSRKIPTGMQFESKKFRREGKLGD